MARGFLFSARGLHIETQVLPAGVTAIASEATAIAVIPKGHPFRAWYIPPR
ncbi:MAG: hypothetical protein LBG73_05415 [Spirochaetaceae bacterium]|nr:hypothetical protein [Spirochaetaceae bacterium]